MSCLIETKQAQSDQALRSASPKLARVLTEIESNLLPKILSDLGRGTMLQSIQRNAPSLLPRILPLLGQYTTGPGNVGSMSGRFGAELAPANLHSVQQGLMAH